VKEILSGLAHLHSNQIVHGDFKPDNILMTTTHDIKLADFTESRSIPKDRPTAIFHSRIQAPGYRAPEVMLTIHTTTPTSTEIRVRYGLKADLWSVGCILFELATGKSLISVADAEDETILTAIFDRLGTPTEATMPGLSTMPQWSPLIYPPRKPSLDLTSLTPDARDLFQSLVSYNPDARPTAEDALKHPFFREGAPAPPAQTPAASTAATATGSASSSATAVATTAKKTK